MRTLDLTRATAPLADYARRAARETVVVTAGGKPLAALVPVPNADLETVRLSTDTCFVALIERSRARQTREGGITVHEMRRRILSTSRSARRRAASR